ncbi:MAG: MFS transporter [Planctomycetes bacterium]|nr:MFS transporter [Planctomycetota bacterium]
MTGQKRLFWACFIALTATSFAFIIRIMILDDLAAKFELTETQKGEILGVGIWPFAVSIVLFSLVIDRIGYGTAIAFAFVGHAAFAFLTIFAEGYWSLYLGSLLGGLAAGSIEAAINPIVATMFHKEKTKWLNILHAGWPAGMVIAGLISIAMGDRLDWQGQVGLIFIPVVLYGSLMAMCRGSFPVNERVAAGVSHKDMLKEVGFLSAFVASALILLEVGRVFELPTWLTWGLIGAGSVGFGTYSGSFGRPLFFILVLIMVPLAITELGTDNWITDLLKSEMVALDANPLWVLVYTTFIMMVLRFMAGPIVHRLSPLGLLAVSSGLGLCGLLFLSQAAGTVIFVAATVYGVGKTFFWPTMLGIVSEQFPKGGALTLNLISGVGMLGAGVIGSQLLGNIQDREVNRELLDAKSELHAQVVAEEEKRSVFGDYYPLDDKKLEDASPEDKKLVAEIRLRAKKTTLTTNAVFPGIMLVAYVLLILWFRSRGGYRPVELKGSGDT